MDKAILIASEDSELILSLRSLLGSGCRVLDAPDSKTGRIIINKGIVSIAIIDISLSKEAGPDTYKEYIKALVEKNILVYLLIEEEEMREVADLNLIEISDDFLIKPVNLDKLLSNIESLLHLKEVEEKVLRQYEKLNLIEEGLISERSKSGYEAKLIEDLRDFMLEMKVKMQEKNKELVESEERYRNLVEAAPDVIFSLSSEDRTVVSLNPAFEKITGWSCAEWHGKSFDRISHPDDVPLAIEKFQQVLQVETPVTLELRILSKSGEYLIWEFIVAPQSKNGKVIGLFGFARNITKHKRAEEAVRKNGKELQKKVKELEEFYDMAINRELQMIELKKEIKELKKRIGEI